MAVETGSPTSPGASPPAKRRRLPGADWRAATFDAFQFPAYRTVWTGTIIAFLAFMMSGTAQGVVAFDLTGNNRAVGLVSFGQGIAMLVLNPFGGAIADRFPKRMLILVAQTVIGITMLAVGLLIVTDNITIGLLALSTFVVGCMFSFLGPTRTAILGEVVDESKLGNAMALVQVGNNFVRIAAPFAATALLSIEVVGAGGTYLVIAALFVVVLATFYQLPVSPPKRARETSVLADVRAGLSHVRQHPRLLHLLVSFHLVTMLGLSNYVLLPGFAKETLDAGNAGLGLILGANAIGGLLMSVVVASLADSKRAPLFLTIAGMTLGLGLIVFGQAPTLLTACLTMVVAGGAGSAFQTLNNAILIRSTATEYIGRVIALMFMAFAIIGVTSFPIGLLADIFGVRVVLSVSGAILCVVVVLLTLWRQRIEAAEAESSRLV